jgi:peptidyl-dipeptidase Dcp
MTRSPPLFHEFGHALHGLFSAVRYPRFSGTSVPRDFVEFPSQVNEMWADLARGAEELRQAPPDRRTHARRAAREGRWPPEVQPGLHHHRVSRRHPARSGVAPAQPPSRSRRRCRAGLRGRRAASRRASTSRPCRPATAARTSRTSSRSGYSAGYYSYIWSEVLDADSVEWFKEHGGLTRANGDRFRPPCSRAAAAPTPCSSTAPSAAASPTSPRCSCAAA